MKKVLSAILALCLMLGSVAVIPVFADSDAPAPSNVWDGSVATGFAGGDGSPEDPYQIANGAQLAYLSSLVAEGDTSAADYIKYFNKCYILVDDIVLNDVVNYAAWGETPPANVFIPIGLGTYSKGGFQGTFDGNGKTITGLYIAPEKRDAGLFDCLGGQATVKDLAIVKSYVKSTGSEVGAIASNIKAGTIPEDGTITVQNIYIEAALVGPDNVGGIIGICQDSSSRAAGSKLVIDSCVFAGSITSSGKYDGGILGNANSFDIEVRNCLNLGEITGSQYVAGIVGISEGAKKNSIQAVTVIENCVNAGKVTATTSGEQYSREIIGSNKTMSQNTGGFAEVNNCFGTQGTLALARHAIIDGDTDNKDDNITDLTLNDVTLESLTGEEAVLPSTSFDAWTKIEKDVMLPTGVVRFGIRYLNKTYTVIWMADGNTVKTEELAMGAMPTPPEAPTKAENDDFTYEFFGWSPTVAPVTGDQSYTAVYTPISKNPDAAWNGEFATSFAGGTGELDDPYQIATGAQLAYFAKMVKTDPENYAGKAYILTDHILLNDVSNYKEWDKTIPSNRWTPVGTYEAPFTGVFDGNGKHIQGMYCAVETEAGFFHALGGEAVIKNFVLLRSMIKGMGALEAGGLAANINVSTIPENGAVTIQGCYIECRISGEMGNIGGYVGLCGTVSQKKDGAKIVIDSCVFDGDINSTGNNAGGIVGNGNGMYLEVSNCLNMANITGIAVSKHYYGGIIGRQDKYSVFTNCINFGMLSGNSVREIANSGKTDAETDDENYPFMIVNNCYGSQDNIQLSKHAIVDGADRDNGLADLNTKTYHSITMEAIRGTEITLPEGFDAWSTRTNDIAVPAKVASFAPNYYNTGETFTVKWDIDGEITEETYNKGDMPSWKGETPTKENDGRFTYTFNGWDPALEVVMGNVTYTAQFFRTRIPSETKEPSKETTKEPEQTKEPATTGEPASEPSTGDDDSTGGGSSTTVIIVIVAVAAVAGAGIGVFFVFKKKKG